MNRIKNLSKMLLIKPKIPLKQLMNHFTLEMNFFYNYFNF